MSPRTYNEVVADARPGRAFSNGTEGECWTANWCDRCAHEKKYRATGNPKHCCQIYNVALGHEPRVTPAEWIDQADPVSGLHRLGDQYHCMYFRPEDDPGPSEPKPIPDPPGQLGMFPREDAEGVRMLTTYPEHEKTGAAPGMPHFAERVMQGRPNSPVSVPQVPPRVYGPLSAAPDTPRTWPATPSPEEN